jgi:integrase
VSIYDRWHKGSLGPGEEPCREHGRGKTKLYPSADHGKGDRWQVRWRDEAGNQRKRNFAKRDGIDPEKHASAFDAKVKAALDDGSYVDPKDANTTLRDFAEDWRQTRTHDVMTAERIERELRLHVYPFIGARSLRELAKRPSLTQAWISGMKLAASSKRQVIRDVSSVYVAAIDDGLINRNPTQAQSVTRPKTEDKKAQPWSFVQVEAMAHALPGRYAVLPYLGAGTGMRQGEMFGLAVDDVVFLGHRPAVHVHRQVRIVAGVLCFAPVKNDKEHDVPLSEALAPLLTEHIRQYPPRAVTLPWRTPGGDPVTFTLVMTRPDGRAMNATRFRESHWWPAQEKAGITLRRETGQKRRPARDQGMHALRHTAASAWLAAGVDIVSVAAWLGDTVTTVYETYAHLMPDADDRGRKAMNAFFTVREGSCAPDVPSDVPR